MLAIPAIDIRGGRCVRLVQGDFARETAYGDDPAAMARHWQEQGAQRLHVVDLDGARDGQRHNAVVIERVIDTLQIPVQVGGGVRTLADAQELLSLGADRVIVGTALVEHPERVDEWLHAVDPEQLVVAVDARGRQVASRGWQTSTDRDVTTFCQVLTTRGVLRVLYTDVERDGMLGGPNVEVTGELASILKVIGSGGVGSVEHLRQLAQAGAEAAIVGTALYEGTISLQEALAC